MKSSWGRLKWITLLVLIVAIIFSWKKRELRAQVAQDPVDINKLSFEYKHGFSVPSCDHPLVFRNIIKYHDDTNCQLTDDNKCGEFIKQRMLEKWSDRLIEAFPATHVSNHAQSAYYDSRAMSLDDYFNDPQYKDYLIHTLHQLGNSQEYQDFLIFDHDTDGTDTSTENNDLYSVVRSIPEWVPLGSQFFISQKNGSGSVMHFAFGLNLFVMLAGRKRWLLVNPAYLDDAHCTTGMTGIYGDCVPNGYLPAHVNISVSEYKRILIEELNIPTNAIVDITLEPGDVLINCPLWAHTIENLNDVTIAYSFRAKLKKTFGNIVWTEKFLSATYQSIKTKLWHNDWAKFTMLDYFWIKFKNSGQDKVGFLDEDERFDGNSFINSKDDDKEHRIEKGT